MKSKKYSVIVLAAGVSRRFGKQNKLLHPYHGRPILAATMEAFSSPVFRQKILVTGFESQRLSEAIDLCGWENVVNERYQEGMGTSIGFGVRHVRDDHQFLICPGDLPHLTPTFVESLIDEWDRLPSDQVALVPTVNGIPGHPVIFAASQKHRLEDLSGPQGGRRDLKNLGDRVCYLPVVSQEGIQDIDYMPQSTSIP